MNPSGNTILITGGATGIGFALAEHFLNAGNKVIICGRREKKLAEAKEKFPALHTRVCDVSDAKQREDLMEWAAASYPGFNVLINNAGIQNAADLKKKLDPESIAQEINTNLTAPIHLTSLAIPYLKKQKEAAIMNVTSGLGFVPLADVPVYCSTKAALHSFTLSLRSQLKDTSIKVFEIIPPIVDTELDKGSRDQRGMANRGIPPSVVAEETLKGFENDAPDIVVGMAVNFYNAVNTPEARAGFERMNSR
jgi:uncharacterized oxidoreductase